MAFDSDRAVAVVFGGEISDGGRLSDTWELAPLTATKRTPATTPPDRVRGAMVFDAFRKRTVLFGGQGANNIFLQDTWEFGL
jgi:hypothetical protein